MAGSNDTAAGSGAAKRNGSSSGGMMIQIIAATGIAVAAGVGLAALQESGATSSATDVTSERPATAKRTLVDLPPIVTNIASPPDLWIRVEASVVVDGALLLPSDVLAAEIAADALAYLRTLTLAQIEGPIGLENIRQDLNDRAMVRSNGRVSELILKTLVLQ